MSFGGKAKTNVIRKAQRIHARRSDMARHYDERLKALLLEVLNNGTHNRNRFDLLYVDTSKMEVNSFS